jgi:hypothetical protein
MTACVVTLVYAGNNSLTEGLCSFFAFVCEKLCHFISVFASTCLCQKTVYKFLSSSVAIKYVQMGIKSEEDGLGFY